MSQDETITRRAGHALDAANFFLADVRDGLGPYLAIYLLTEQKWDEAAIGLVMSLATIAGIVAQTPAGAMVDATRAKRLIMIAAALIVTAASLLLPLMASFWPVAISQSIAHAAGVIFAPAIAAVSLGIFGVSAFTARIGRNETFNHAGNAVGAVIAGAAAYALGPSAVFYLMALMSVGSLISVLAIPARAIDHEVARDHHGLAGEDARNVPRVVGVVETAPAEPSDARHQHPIRIRAEGDGGHRDPVHGNRAAQALEARPLHHHPDQVFADIVDIAFDSTNDNFADPWRAGFRQQGAQNPHSGLHRVCRHQNFRNKQNPITEIDTYNGHPFN